MKNRIPQGWMIPQLPHIKILITEISLEKSSIQQYIYVQFTYLFTSFSRHRPAQRKCARTGLRSHARYHPYPIPQPVKVGHTTGVYVSCSFRTLGTLRSEDGGGSENVAEKVNSRSFNFHSDYSKSLTLSNVGEPS